MITTYTQEVRDTCYDGHVISGFTLQEEKLVRSHKQQTLDKGEEASLFTPIAGTVIPTANCCATPCMHCQPAHRKQLSLCMLRWGRGWGLGLDEGAGFPNGC